MFEQSAPAPGDGADHDASDGPDRRTAASDPERTDRPHGEPTHTGREAARSAVLVGR